MTLEEQAVDLMQQHWLQCLTNSGCEAVFFITPSDQAPVFHALFETFLNTISQDTLSAHCHKLSDSCYCHPYFPFLDIIRQELGRLDLDIDESLAAADVYSLHRPIFSQILRQEEAVREQAILFTEFAYEVGEMQRSLMNLLLFISKKRPLIIAISQFHFASPALREFVSKIKINKV